MHRGLCLSIPWRDACATSIGTDSRSPLRAAEVRRGRFNVPVMQVALRARGRNWREGRIAECPRMQQNDSSDDLPFCCKIVPSSVLSITPRCPRQALLPPFPVGVVVAPSRPATPRRARGRLCCATCNIRNEVISHVAQLPIDVFPGNNSVRF